MEGCFRSGRGQQDRVGPAEDAHHAKEQKQDADAPMTQHLGEAFELKSETATNRVALSLE